MSDQNSKLRECLKRASEHGQPTLVKDTEWSYVYKTVEKSYSHMSKFLADENFTVNASGIRQRRPGMDERQRLDFVQNFWAKPTWDSNDTEILEVVMQDGRDLPSERKERKLVLLERFGSGAGPWSGFPSYETAAEDLQFDFSTTAIAARDKAGKLWLAITNVDPNQSAELEVSLAGISVKSAVGQMPTAPKVDTVNTFDAPNTVVPKPISAKGQAGKLTLKLEPKSITAIIVEQ